MLLPNNVSPDKSLYFLGGIVLEIIKSSKLINVDELYVEALKRRDISYQLMILTLDWLFAVGAIDINDVGEIRCIDILAIKPTGSFWIQRKELHA